jgi:hypothetical protein
MRAGCRFTSTRCPAGRRAIPACGCSASTRGGSTPGEEWRLDPSGRQIVERGTPVLIVGDYDFTADPPWVSLERLSRGIALPPGPAGVPRP